MIYAEANLLVQDSMPRRPIAVAGLMGGFQRSPRDMIDHPRNRKGLIYPSAKHVGSEAKFSGQSLPVTREAACEAMSAAFAAAVGPRAFAVAPERASPLPAG